MSDPINSYVALNLADNAYVGSPVQPIVDDWQEIAPVNGVGTSALAVVFVDDTDRQIDISFKGTNSLDEAVSDLANDGAAEWNSIADNIEAEYANLESNPSYTGYTFFTSGHSLGGGMAQTFSAIEGISGYGFNSLPIAPEVYDTLDDSNSKISEFKTQADGSAPPLFFDETNVAGDIATWYYSNHASDYISTETHELASQYSGIEHLSTVLAPFTGGLSLLVAADAAISAHGRPAIYAAMAGTLPTGQTSSADVNAVTQLVDKSGVDLSGTEPNRDAGSPFGSGELDITSTDGSQGKLANGGDTISYTLLQDAGDAGASAPGSYDGVDRVISDANGNAVAHIVDTVDDAGTWTETILDPNSGAKWADEWKKADGSYGYDLTAEAPQSERDALDPFMQAPMESDVIYFGSFNASDYGPNTIIVGDEFFNPLTLPPHQLGNADDGPVSIKVAADGSVTDTWYFSDPSGDQPDDPSNIQQQLLISADGTQEFKTKGMFGNADTDVTMGSAGSSVSVSTRNPFGGPAGTSTYTASANLHVPDPSKADGAQVFSLAAGGISEGAGEGDTFNYSSGTGSTYIEEESFDSSVNNVLNMSASAQQLTVAADADGNLHIGDGVASDDVVVLGMMASAFDGVQQVNLSDGTAVTRSQLLAAATVGTTGSDNLYGSSYSASHFDGKGGSDTETGTSGQDTFAYSAGYGSLVINETAASGAVPASTLVLHGIAASSLDVAASSDWSGLVLTDGVSGDQISLSNMLQNSASGVQRVVFDDGTTWTADDLLTRANTQYGTSGDDTLTGSTANDAFDGEGGNDVVTGGGGNDIYIVKPTYGVTTIVNGDSGDDAAAGTLDLSGVNADQIWLQQSGNDLKIEEMGTDTGAVVSGWFSQTSSQLASITVDGGSQGAMTLDSQLNQLIQVMANYSADNPGFDPAASGNTAITDPMVLAAVQSAWHH